MAAEGMGVVSGRGRRSASAAAWSDAAALLSVRLSPLEEALERHRRGRSWVVVVVVMAGAVRRLFGVAVGAAGMFGCSVLPQVCGASVEAPQWIG